MAKITAILVHYHTAELAAESVRALREDAASSQTDLEIVLVDNGSSREDRRQLRTLEVDSYLDPGTNLGYAAGANLGLREVSAELAIVINPDVTVVPGCLEELVRELEGGTSAVAPRLYWNRAKTFMLPPTERCDRVSVLLATLASRGGFWAGLARRRWRRHARSHWLAESPIVSWDLSGALLGIRMDAWHRIGPFDEGYHLYFEETDWLLRLRREGLAAKVLPAAEAIHLYAQASRNEAATDSWFEQSAHRFRRKHYGAAFCRLLEMLAVPEEAATGAGGAGRDDGGQRELGSSARWLEISESKVGFPAAAHRLDPAELGRGSLSDSLYRLTADLGELHGLRLTVLDAHDRELTRCGLGAQNKSPSPMV